MQYVDCPHCGTTIEIEALNCRIFRCGVYKADKNKSVAPHASKAICDELKEKDLIYGCGKPFRIIDNKAVICDYI